MLAVKTWQKLGQSSTYTHDRPGSKAGGAFCAQIWSFALILEAHPASICLVTLKSMLIQLSER